MAGHRAPAPCICTLAHPSSRAEASRAYVVFTMLAAVPRVPGPCIQVPARPGGTVPSASSAHATSSLPTRRRKAEAQRLSFPALLRKSPDKNATPVTPAVPLWPRVHHPGTRRLPFAQKPPILCSLPAQHQSSTSTTRHTGSDLATGQGGAVLEAAAGWQRNTLPIASNPTTHIHGAVHYKALTIQIQLRVPLPQQPLRQRSRRRAQLRSAAAGCAPLASSLG